MSGGAFRLFQRKSGIFYAQDAETRRPFSLNDCASPSNPKADCFGSDLLMLNPR